MNNAHRKLEGKMVVKQSTAQQCQKFKTFENIKIDLKQQSNQVIGCWMMGHGHLSV
jgi:hypothetical protein